MLDCRNNDFSLIERRCQSSVVDGLCPCRQIHGRRKINTPRMKPNAYGRDGLLESALSDQLLKPANMVRGNAAFLKAKAEGLPANEHALSCRLHAGDGA